MDLCKSVESWSSCVASPRSAASVHGVGHEGDCVVAAVARYNTIQTASRESKALQAERSHKLAALAQAGERDAAIADGRPHGAASDGDVLGGRQSNSGELASPSQPPSHLPTPLTFPRDGVGARRSFQPSLVVVMAPLWSSGAARRPVLMCGAGQRGLRLRLWRGGCMMRSLVIAPRSRCWAFLGL